MGWLTDVLKEIPLSAVLKEKIAAIEEKHAAIETENAILKDDLREAKAEVAKLKKQIEELTDKNLDEIEVQLLILLSKEMDGTVTGERASDQLSLAPQRTRYYLRKLTDNGYVFMGRGSESAAAFYMLLQKGREYLIKNDLI